MAKLTSQQKQVLIYCLILLAILFSVKWIFDHTQVKIFPYDLFPSVSKSPQIELTAEQRYKLYLYEKSSSWANFTKMRAIAEAESGWRQYDSEGNVLVGYKDGRDYGIFQIRDIHIKKAEELGMDIKTPEGNIDYALYLFGENGTRDWNASKKNWIKLL